MPRWAIVAIIIVILILIVGNPSGAGTWLGNFVNGILTFFKSVHIFG